jgi:hypothetical protein
MNFARTFLAVLAGVIIGAAIMTAIRPQPVKAQEPSRRTVEAQGGTVFVDTINPTNAGAHRIQGSRVVGYSCVQATTNTPPWCSIASQ